MANTTYDIRKTGPQGYRDLQNANNNAYSMSSEPHYISLYDRSTHATQIVDDPLADTGRGWGQSRYDNAVANENEFQHLGDVRAGNQSFLDAIGNGVVKAGGKALTTIGSVVGLGVGLGEAIVTGTPSKIWNNEVFDLLDEVDKSFEDNFSVYATEAEQNADWWTLNYLTSKKFWADSVITNVGFTLGSMAVGAGAAGLMGKTLSAFGRAAQLGTKAQAAQSLLASAVAGSGEAALEAKDAYKTYKEGREMEMNASNAQYMQEAQTQLQAEYTPLLQQAMAKYEKNKERQTVPDGEGGFVDPAYIEYQQTVAALQSSYQDRLAVYQEEANRRNTIAMSNIEKEAKSVGNKVMAANQVLLTGSNFLQFGKAFTKSFKNAAGLEGQVNKMASRNGITTNVGDVIKDTEIANAGRATAMTAEEAGSKALLTGLESKTATNGFETALGYGKAFLKNPWYEGSEEMNQQWISSSAISYHHNQYKDVNDFWNDKYDQYSKDFSFSDFANSLGNTLSAVEQGFSDSWLDPKQWEQFLVGAMMGGSGMAMMNKAGKSDTNKKWFNPTRWFSWEGGSIKAVLDYSRQQKTNKEANNTLNTLLQDPKLQTTLQDLAEKTNDAFILEKIQRAQGQAIEEGEQKTYKDLEDKYFAHVINTFAKAGKIDDLKAIYSYYAGKTDAEIEKLIDETIKNNYVSADQDKQNHTAETQAKIDVLKRELQEAFNAYNEASAYDNQEAMSSYNSTIISIQEEIDALEEDMNNYQGQEYYKPNLFTDENGQQKPEFDSTQKVQDYFKKNSQSLLSKIDDYVEGVNLIQKQFAGKLDNDKEDNLLYLWMRNKGSLNRFNSMFDTLTKSTIFPNKLILSRVETLKDKDGKDNKVEHKDAKSLAESMGLNADLIHEREDGNFEINLNSIPKERAGAVLVRAMGSQENVNLLNRELNNSARNNNDPATIAQLIDDVNTFSDAIKTYSDAMEYYNTLIDYMSHPEKIDKDKEKAAQENKKKENVTNKQKYMNSDVSDIVNDMENGDFDIDSLGELEEGDDELQKKVESANDIVETKKSVHKRIDNSGMSDSAKKTAHNMIDKSSEFANDVDELLDMESEAFFDDVEESSFTDEDLAELEAFAAENQEEVQQAVSNKRAQIEEEARSELADIIESIKEDRREKDAITSDTEQEVQGNTKNNEKETGADPTEKLDPVNSGSDDTKIASTNEDTDQEIVTPSSVSDTVPAESANKGNNETLPRDSSGQALYWKSNTTQEGIHNLPGNHAPYHESGKDPKADKHAIIHEYLEKNGAFERMNEGAVHKDSKVRVGFDTTLNKAVGTMVPLLYVEDSENPGNWVLVGDMVSAIDNYSQFPNYQAFLDKLSEIKESNEGINHTNIYLTVNDVLLGKPQYSKTEERHTLNEIANGKEIHIAVATKNPQVVIVDSKMIKNPRTAHEQKVKVPLTQTPGQPFILVGDDVNGYMCIPIRLPKFSAQQAEQSALCRAVINVAKSFDHLNEMSQDEILLLKNELQLLLNFEKLWIAKTNSGKWGISFKIPGQKKNTLTFDENASNISQNTLQAFENAGVGYQVDISMINDSEAMVEGMPYNQAIGELADTNLEIGGLHLVNNFPIFNYLDANGNEIKAEKPKGVDTENVEAVEKAQKTVDALNNQEVGRPTPSDNTYTIDGKKYQRVHTIMGSNSASEINEQGRLNGARATTAGTEVDNIIRQFFNGVEPNAIKYNESIVSKQAFAQLIKQLEPIRKYFATPNKNRKWEAVYANNIVVAHDFNGVPVAGEIDILTVDDKGNFRIYDIKTSKNSFAEESYGRVKSYQKRSDREEHTRQLTFYADMLEKEYGVKVVDLVILPFNVKFQNGDRAISGKTDPVVNITKVPSIKLQRSTTSTQAAINDYSLKAKIEKARREAKIHQQHIAEDKKKLFGETGEPQQKPLKNTETNKKRAAKLVEALTAKGASDIDKINAISSIEENQRDGMPLTTEQQAIVDKEKKRLQEQGYSWDTWKVGDTYDEGFKITADFTADDNLHSDTQIITSIRKPGIMKNGKMVQAPNVMVTQGSRVLEQQSEKKEQPVTELPVTAQEEASKAEPSTPKGKSLARDNTINSLSDKSFLADFNENRDIVELLTDEQLATLNSMKNTPKTRKFWQSFINDVDRSKPLDSKTVRELFDTLTISNKEKKFSKVTESNSHEEQWNEKTRQKELDKIAEMLPQLSQEERVRIVDTLERIAGKGNPEAWGKYQRGIITLYKNAIRGTAYHEAFHYVIDSLLSDSEKSRMFAMGRAEYGSQSIFELEEAMADGFKEYCVMREDASLGKRIMNFFKDLRHSIGIFYNAKDKLDATYGRIYRGKYADRQEYNQNNQRQLTESSAKYSPVDWDSEVAKQHKHLEDVFSNKSDHKFTHENAPSSIGVESRIEEIAPIHKYHGEWWLKKLPRESDETGDIVYDTGLAQKMIYDYLDSHNIPRDVVTIVGTPKSAKIVFNDSAILQHLQDEYDNMEEAMRLEAERRNEESTKWTRLDPEMQNSLMNRGVSESTWNMLPFEERDYIIQCL